MTLTFSELSLVLEALDMATSRRQSQANYYEARPERFSRNVAIRHADKSAAMHDLSCRISQLRPRRDVLGVA